VAGEDAEPRKYDWIAWGTLGGGLTYPAWRLAAPPDALDPLLPWLVLGLATAASGLFRLLRTAKRESWWLQLHSFAVALHLHALVYLNPTESFFLVAALVQAIVTLLLLPQFRQVLVFALVMAVLALVPLVLRLSNANIYFGGAVASLLYIVFGHLGKVRSERLTAKATLVSTQSELEHERAERQRLENELRTAQRMDSLGRLAGAFSHEFNNQLMAIRIHADLLARSVAPDAPQRRDVAQIQQTTSAAADLTARLLAFSRPNRTREEPADLCAALRQNLVTLRHLMAENTPVALSVPEEPVVAPVGAKQLGQILLNLALNARDAMPSGGSLRLEVARVPRRSVELPVDMPGDELARFTVSDSGVGMGPDVLDRLYEPFFTTKSDRGNSGLGLSVVYGLVKDTGGYIRVTSEPGAGARFDIYWPLATPAARTLRAAPAVDRRPPRARVLLVEDQAVLREGLTRWLGDQGYAVVPCESAEEALPRVASVDVIASDVVLPGMDGIELLDRARRAAPELPAVLFSGHLDHLAARSRQIPDGVMFLEKPFAPEALQSTLEALVGRRLRPVAAC
jgi:signal transduction histidine kinase/CheY-like chemotaxis protein